MSTRSYNIHPLEDKFTRRGIKVSHFLAHKNGVSFSIYVHAKPGSKQEKIIPDSDGNLIIHTHARPIDGQANEAIRVIIAKYFRLSKSCVEVTRGEKSRYKHVIVTIFFTDSKDLAYYLET